MCCKLKKLCAAKLKVDAEIKVSVKIKAAVKIVAANKKKLLEATLFPSSLFCSSCVENCPLEAKYCHKCGDYIEQNITLKAIAGSIFIMRQVLFVCKKLFKIAENFKFATSPLWATVH